MMQPIIIISFVSKVTRAKGRHKAGCISREPGMNRKENEYEEDTCIDRERGLADHANVGDGIGLRANGTLLHSN